MASGVYGLSGKLKEDALLVLSEKFLKIFDKAQFQEQGMTQHHNKAKLGLPKALRMIDNLTI
jgi:hypothetical protein